MGKVESSFKNMVITLFIITLVASFALGSIYNLTKGPIAMADNEARENSIKEVIPEFDTLITLRVKVHNGPDSLTFNKGFKGGEYVGTAIATFSNNGYDPTQIRIMIGFLPDGNINNTIVIQQKETPGLGTKMKETKFRDQFIGKNPSDFKLKVKKDGGDVDAITAATISSRAFCEAIENAYQTLKKEKEGEK